MRSKLFKVFLFAMLSCATCFAQTQENLENNRNRRGSDYRNYELPQADPVLCQNDCANDPTCKAFTYIKPGVQGPKARCALKSAVPDAVADNCCVSGIKKDGVTEGALEVNADRRGGDYRDYDLQEANPYLCQKDCENDPKCQAFTYMRPSFWGPNAHCFLKDRVPDLVQNNCCLSGVKKGAQEGLELNTNRRGSDYRNYELSQADPAICQNDCAKDPTCKAFTYYKPGVQGPKPRCELKSAVPDAVADNCCVSGIKKGGVTEGALEVNADRRGGDYRDYDLQEANPNQCKKDCENDPKCRAFTYMRPSFWGPKAHCFLKDCVPALVQNSCCLSGVKSGGDTTAAGSDSNAGGNPDGTCGGAATYSIIATPNVARPGDQVIVRFRFPGDKPAGREWVSLFNPGERDWQQKWKYANDLLPNCEMTFTAPSTPGPYEFRYLDEANRVLASTTLTVGTATGLAQRTEDARTSNSASPTKRARTSTEIAKS